MSFSHPHHSLSGQVITNTSVTSRLLLYIKDCLENSTVYLLSYQCKSTTTTHQSRNSFIRAGFANGLLLSDNVQIIRGVPFMRERLSNRSPRLSASLLCVILPLLIPIPCPTPNIYYYYTTDNKLELLFIIIIIVLINTTTHRVSTTAHNPMNEYRDRVGDTCVSVLSPVLTREKSFI